MRKKQQQDYVRPITTGHVEADMLGQCYLWLSERKNSNNAHKTHRKKTVRMSTKSKLRVAVKRSWRYLNEILRRICALPGKGYRMVRRGISSLRNNKRNGN